jgi:hypothetical protein
VFDGSVLESAPDPPRADHDQPEAAATTASGGTSASCPRWSLGTIVYCRVATDDQLEHVADIRKLHDRTAGPKAGCSFCARRTAQASA